MIKKIESNYNSLSLNYRDLINTNEIIYTANNDDFGYKNYKSIILLLLMGKI